MVETLRLDFNGRALQLLPGRAVHWPAQQMLLIADLHLGKDHLFRQAGIAVPVGSLGDDLARLDALIATFAPHTLCILGDLVHGAVTDSPWRSAWRDWRAQHARMRIIAVPGNHDRALAGDDLGVDLVGAAYVIDGVTLSHAPLRDGLVQICGHVHPVVKLPRVPGQHAAFVLEAGRLILPAFSQFTGGFVCTPARGRRLYVCTDRSVVALPGEARAHGQKER